MRELTKVKQQIVMLSSKEHLIQFLIKKTKTDIYQHSEIESEFETEKTDTLFYSNKEGKLKKIENIPKNYPIMCLVSGIPNDIKINYLELI